MSSILYYSNYCDHSKELLEFAAWNDLKLVDEIPLVDYISPKDNESNNFTI